VVEGSQCDRDLVGTLPTDGAESDEDLVDPDESDCHTHDYSH